jgi:GTP-binding protein
MPLPSVVLVGRVNVGKSALFNRLTESRKAITSPIAGTTRDYNVARMNWVGKTFNLIDTGGISTEALRESIEHVKPSSKSTARRREENLHPELIEQKIIEQTQRAITQADVVILVVDGQAGIMPEDREIARMIDRLGKPTILACNKIDGPKHRENIPEFYKLGLGEPVALSASSGVGTGDLLDMITDLLVTPNDQPEPETHTDPVKIAVMGRPNVGKSSLVNAILGEERVIVSPIPHTTREPQDTEIMLGDQPIILIDTAGLRRKSKVNEMIEQLSNSKSIATIKRADVVLLTLEATAQMSSQDLRLARLLADYQVSTIIVASKWDMVPNKDETSADTLIDYYRVTMPHLRFAPVMMTSTETGHNVKELLPLAIKIWHERCKTIPQDQLTIIMKKAAVHHKPVKAMGQNYPKLQKLEQTRTNPPEFTVTIGHKQSLHFSYIRFIENQLRLNFGFVGTPIKVHVFAQPKRALG